MIAIKKGIIPEQNNASTVKYIAVIRSDADTGRILTVGDAYLKRTIEHET